MPSSPSGRPADPQSSVTPSSRRSAELQSGITPSSRRSAELQSGIIPPSRRFAEPETLAASSPRRSGMPPTAAATQCSDHPSWVLLDTYAHIRCCRNATTAEAKTSAGHNIVVSFSVTHPPGLSGCFVHCPDLPAEAFCWPPRVTGADGAVVLIRVVFAECQDRGRCTDIFVYQAGHVEPSLYLLPRPYPVGIYSDHVGALSCGEHHLVVIPEPRFEARGQMVYDLHVFSSETMSWSTTVVPVAIDNDTDFGLLARHHATKVISIGGVWLGWIDLRRGILLCDVVAKLPAMRLMQLPSLLPTNKVDFEEGFDGAIPPLRPIRDVTCRNGLFRFIEIEYPELDDSSTQFKWSATMFTREICSENWQWWCAMDSADLSPTETCLSDLFPVIWDGSNLTLDKVTSSAPTLDLYNENMFYMRSKLSAFDTNGWVLAVDARNRTLENAVPFSNDKFHFDPTYQQCSFSKHLMKPPGARTTNVFKANISKEDYPPLVSYVISVLLGQHQFRQFEKYLANDWPCYDYGRVLVMSGQTLTLCVNIQEIAQYAATTGLGNAASEAATMFMLAFENIRDFVSHDPWSDSAYPPASDEDIRNRVMDAIGALDNLLQTVPPEILDEGRIVADCCKDEILQDGDIVEKFASQSINWPAPSEILDAGGDIRSITSVSCMDHEAVEEGDPAKKFVSQIQSFVV